MNLDFDAFAADPKFPITNADLTDRELAWHPTVDRDVGERRYDPAGNRLVIEEIPEENTHEFAHHEYGSMVAIWEEPKWDRLIRAFTNQKRIGQYRNIQDGKVNRCEERTVLDDDPSRTSFEEVDYFRIYENKYAGNGEWIGITVQPTLLYDEDQDTDGIPRNADEDMDGDRIPNLDDDDMDGDRLERVDDEDIDGDGINDYGDMDVDDDGIPNSQDMDVDGDGIPNATDQNVDGDALDNASEYEKDIDGDGITDEADPDIDGDGVPNMADEDMDLSLIHI